MRVVDYLRLLLLAAIWGASFLFMRVAVPQFGAINTAFLRVLFGCSGLAVILFIFRSPFNFKNKFRPSVTLGVINSGLPFLMYCLAAKWLPTGYSAVLNATTPMMGTLIGFFCFAEKLTVRKWLGVFLGLAGITLIISVGEGQSADKKIYGVIACLIATGCYGVAGFLTRRWISEKGGLDPKLVAFGSQLGATVFLLPFFIWSLGIEPAVNWANKEAWMSVLAVGLVCTAAAYIIYFRLISDIGPLKTLTVSFLIPPFGVLWGYLALGETINHSFILGSAIIGVAVWMVVSPEKR